MIEEKRRTMRGDPDKEANVWVDQIAEADRQRARAQDLAIEGLLSPNGLRDKLATLEETRETAKGELEVLKERMEEVEELERDRDALLKSYRAMVAKVSMPSALRTGAGPTTACASTSSPTRTAP